MDIDTLHAEMEAASQRLHEARIAYNCAAERYRQAALAAIATGKAQGTISIPRER